MQHFNVLLALVWGCNGSSPITGAGEAYEKPPTIIRHLLLMLLLISISLLLILTAGVYFVWKVLLRHHRDLQSAQVSLLQQELKNASLTHQLREARERYKELEDEYYDMQYEMAKEVKDPPAGL